MSETNAQVFVVDDDLSIREALESLLRSAGLSVQTFSSAQDFLAPGRADMPSCLVLDVQMPGLNGLDLQSELIAAHNQIPIIFITGHGIFQRLCAPSRQARWSSLPNLLTTRICSTPSGRELPAPARHVNTKTLSNATLKRSSAPAAANDRIGT
jgi:CheY-like chemotaxis protein